MGESLLAGSSVATSRFGPGKVVRLTRTGAIIAIERMGGLELDVPLAEISVSAVPTAAPPRPAMPSDVSDDAYRARRSVEALRFGIVPIHSIRDLTLGREQLEGWLMRQLPHERGGESRVSEISG